MAQMLPGYAHGVVGHLKFTLTNVTFSIVPSRAAL